MNTLLLLSIFILVSNGAKIMHEIEAYVDHKCPILEKGTCPKGDEITYWLSTSSSKGNQVKLDLGSLQKAPFVNGPLKIWFHGYTDHHDSPIVKEVINGYVSRGDYNVVVVDWNAYCKKGCYLQSTQSIPAVGHCAAQFLSALLKAHSFSNVHLLGHSLGAHSAAWASVDLPGLQRLTKFDPAMPLFTVKGSKKGAAKFIDVYHSNCDIAGQKDPTGDVDVYFNTAKFQPGCKCDIACSHARCVTYFLESVGNQMKAFPCRDWNAYLTNKCPTPKPADLVNVGDGIDPKTRGVFMAFTKDKAPYLEQVGAYTRPNIFESFKTILVKEECSVTKYASLIKDWVEGKVEAA